MTSCHIFPNLNLEFNLMTRPIQPNSHFKMHLRPSLSPSTKLLRLPISKCLPSHRALSLFPSSTTRSHTNRIFDPIRTPQDLHTLTMLNAADNRTLITLWSAKWCQTCATVTPLVLRLLQEDKVGEAEGGLGYATVEMDSTLIEDLPVRFRVRMGSIVSARM